MVDAAKFFISHFDAIALGLLVFVLLAFLISARAKLSQPTAAAASPSVNRLTIHSAFYGNNPEDDRSVLDVLNRQIHDGLVLSIDNNTLQVDPAPGREKWLKVEYSYGNAYHKIVRPEYSRMVLPEDSYLKQLAEKALAPPIQVTPRLKIHAAIYGTAAKYKDVTERVRQFVNVDTLTMLASNEVFQGDPAPGEDDKSLTVEYSIDGGPVRKAVRPQSRLMVLPEDLWLVDQIENLQTEVSKYAPVKPQRVNPEVERQLEGLTLFELLAMKHMVQKRGMTCEFFSDMVTRWGPVGKSYEPNRSWQNTRDLKQQNYSAA